MTEPQAASENQLIAERHTKLAADSIRAISQDMARIVDRFQIGPPKTISPA